MTNIIPTKTIEKQLAEIYAAQQEILTEQPILLKVSDSLYAIGQADNENPDELQMILTTDALEIVPQTKYDPNGWTDDITTDSSLFQYDNGYLVLTEQGYLFTPHMYRMGCNEPYTPNETKTDIEVSLLMLTQSITLSTHKYKTLTLSPKEWAQLSKESMSNVVSELLIRGENKETYSNEEFETLPSQESTLLINGQEQLVWLDESAREQLFEHNKSVD